MAINIDTSTINNITEYPNSFKRQGAFPLERYSLFNSLDDAQTYASDNPIAYVGQILSVVNTDTNEVVVYKIADTDGTLTQIDASVASSLPSATSSTKGAVQLPTGENSIVVAVDDKVVHKAGEESIPGNKTFTGNVIVNDPTADGHAANKKYVDGLVQGGIRYKGTVTIDPDGEHPVPINGPSKTGDLWVIVTDVDGDVVTPSWTPTLSYGYGDYIIIKQDYDTAGQVPFDEQYMDFLNTQDEDAARLGSDNIFTGNNTFSNAPTITTSGTGNQVATVNQVNTAVSTAINTTLTVTGGASETNKFVTSVTKTNGTITVTKAQPTIANVNGLQTALNEKADLSGAKFTGAVTVITPTSDMHAATKKYVDDKVGGLSQSEIKSPDGNHKVTTANSGVTVTNGSGVTIDFGATSGTVVVDTDFETELSTSNKGLTREDVKVALDSLDLSTGVTDGQLDITSHTYTIDDIAKIVNAILVTLNKVSN